MRVKKNYYDDGDLDCIAKVYIFSSTDNKFVECSDSKIDELFYRIFMYNDLLPRKDEIVIDQKGKEYRIKEIKTYYSYEMVKQFYLTPLSNDNLIIKNK